MSIRADGPIPLIVITGPPGVGKSTTAVALSDLLSQRDRCHALLDMDALRWLHPAPEADPRNVQLGLTHLGALAASYRAAGAELLIIADVVPIESPHAMFELVIPDSRATIVRLDLPLAEIAARLQHREPEAQHDWYLQKADLVARAYTTATIGDLIIDCTTKSPDHIAREILAHLN